MLGKDDPVCADLLQHPLVNVALGLAHHLFHPLLLQVQGDEGGVAHVAAHGHDAAVVVAHSKGLEHGGVTGVAADGMGDLVGPLLHGLSVGVHRQDLMAQSGQLPGDGGSKPAQANDHKCFHIPHLSDHYMEFGIFDLIRYLSPGQEGDGHRKPSYPANIHQ